MGKFARYTGATPVAGRFTAGGFTNHLQSKFSEPRLLVAADPRIDHQSITESSYVNIPASAPATDWAAETEVHSQQQQGFAQQPPAAAPSTHWATQVSSATDDWSATAAAAPAVKSDWGGTAQGSWDA